MKTILLGAILIVVIYIAWPTKPETTNIYDYTTRYILEN